MQHNFGSIRAYIFASQSQKRKTPKMELLFMNYFLIAFVKLMNASENISKYFMMFSKANAI